MGAIGEAREIVSRNNAREPMPLWQQAGQFLAALFAGKKDRASVLDTARWLDSKD